MEYDPHKARQWVTDERYDHKKELAKNIQKISKEQREELYWKHLATAGFKMDDEGIALVCEKCDNEISSHRWSSLYAEEYFTTLRYRAKALREAHICFKPTKVVKRSTYQDEIPTKNHRQLPLSEPSYNPSPLSKRKSRVSPESFSKQKQYL